MSHYRGDNSAGVAVLLAFFLIFLVFCIALGFGVRTGLQAAM